MLGPTARCPAPPLLSPGKALRLGWPIPAPQGKASASGLQVTWTPSGEFHHTLVLFPAHTGGTGRRERQAGEGGWGGGLAILVSERGPGQPSWPEKAETASTAPVPPPAQPGEAEAEWGQEGHLPGGPEC